jgi:hypothetical protein
MFIWYRNAQICYAYLSDVAADFRNPETSEIMNLYAALERSQWFTRGWTLQELLAPQWVVSLASDWTQIGTKATLANEIASITGITHLFNIQDASIAQKMSWAAHRRTTRVEDEAYCMMGLFDVNMPLIYGEGRKAFIRLQLEILSRSDDESIFAWTDPTSRRTGLLADTPAGFVGCGYIKRWKFDYERPPHFMTNKGLQMELLMRPLLRDANIVETAHPEVETAAAAAANEPKAYMAPLNCVLENEDGSSDVVLIHLLERDGVFSRYGDPEPILPELIHEAQVHLERRTCHIAQPGHNNYVAETTDSTTVSYTMTFDIQALSESGYFVSERLIWLENANMFENGKVLEALDTGELVWSRDASLAQSANLLTVLETGLKVTEDFAVVISSSKQYILLRCESPSGPTFSLILGYLSGRPWIGALTTDQMPLKDLASSFDKHKRWPQSQGDPRSLQERGWVQIAPNKFITLALHKTGIGTYSGEKYLVSSQLREQPDDHPRADSPAPCLPTDV